MLFPHSKLALFDSGSFHVEIMPALNRGHQGATQIARFRNPPLSIPLSRPQPPRPSPPNTASSALVKLPTPTQAGSPTSGLRRGG